MFFVCQCLFILSELKQELEPEALVKEKVIFAKILLKKLPIDKKCLL